MRLSFEPGLGPSGEKLLRVRLGAATVTDEHSLPYDEARVERLSHQLVGVLRRGNRTRALADGALAELRFLGDELHRALIPQSLERELQRGSGPLLLDLDETLVAVPFELLHDGSEFLCRRYALGRAVRSSVPRRGQERRSLGMPPRALVIASDPRGDLPEVEAESDAIIDALEHEKVRARLLGEATRESLRRELKDFDIVHFAGHADFIVSDPSASGWHLSDGKLTAADVADLGGGRPMPLVIFSNACESGRTGEWSDADASGEGRRAYGLAGAFLYAGVRHYVGTQWEVVDGHSATFATAFYQNLGSGQAIGAAVRNARHAVIQTAGEGALAWASYVLYGDPADRPLRRTDPKRLSMPSAKELAMRESAPWKRPTPQTMKRVGAEISAKHEIERITTPPPNHTARALLAGSAAGLLVTGIAAAVLWARMPQPSRLALLPIGASDAAVAARVEACLETVLTASGASLVGKAQIAALGKTTAVAPNSDPVALQLGTALGAHWVLWGVLDGTPSNAELRLLEVKTGKLLRASRLPTEDLAAPCAAEAAAIQSSLR